MGFKSNFAEADTGYGIKPEGDYEMLIVKAEEKTNKNGKTCLNLSLVIRNDVDQKFQNGYVFHRLWKRREPTAADMAVNGYGFGQIMALGKAARLPDGKDYAGLADFLNDLMMKPVLIHIKHEEYNGEMRETVSSISETKHPDVRHVMKMKKPDVTRVSQSDSYAQKPTAYANQASAALAPASGFVEMPLDDDLPF